mgnify:CR=1 FL=1
MPTLKNLGYRIKSFLMGESGIVEKVEQAPLIDENDRVISYPVDYYSNLPMQVTFRNPLGEQIKSLTSMTLKDIEFKHSFKVFVYKIYRPGDKFPWERKWKN